MCAVAAAEPCLHRGRAVPACGWVAELRPRCGWAVFGLQPSCARIAAELCPLAVGQCLHRGWAALRWHRPWSLTVSVRLAARLRPSTLRQPVKRYEHLTGFSPRRRRARQFSRSLRATSTRSVFREAVFPKPCFRGWETFLLACLVVRGRLSNIGKPELAILLDVVNRALRDIGP